MDNKVFSTHTVDTLTYNKEKQFKQSTNLTHSLVPCVAHSNAFHVKIISAVHDYVPKDSRGHSDSQ